MRDMKEKLIKVIVESTRGIEDFGPDDAEDMAEAVMRLVEDEL